ncbi:MAG: glutamate racemase [Actinobacteria bacterium]|nr:glutamate racemase [Actinomycetota bacterium]
MDNRAVGIFDSGVGGLSVLKEINKILPHEDLIYLGDVARFPYGPKSLRDVRGFVHEIVDFLYHLNVKLIVIACNTATAAGLESIKGKYDVPILGVISPGAQAACSRSRRGRIGVISTIATAQSGMYEHAIKNLNHNCRVFTQACPKLVELIEDGVLNGKVLDSQLMEYLESLIAQDIDTLILGCTHYPLIEEEIKKIINGDITVISSARETARAVKEYLISKDMLQDGILSSNIRFLSTGGMKSFQKVGSIFLGKQITDIEIVNLSSRGSIGV